MFGIILSSSCIIGCIWIGMTSAIVAYRHRERVLALLAASTLLLGIRQTIPLTNLLVGGFGTQMESWLIVQLGLFLLAIAGLASFNLAGGLPRLRTKGLSLKRILLLRTP
jgi:hypothetical protein